MPRRQIEATAADWKRWDRAAKLEGITLAAFARRALEQRCSSIAELEQAAQRVPAVRQRLPGLKGG
jgi:hypothetical protein